MYVFLCGAERENKRRKIARPDRQQIVQSPESSWFDRSDCLTSDSGRRRSSCGSSAPSSMEISTDEKRISPDAPLPVKGESQTQPVDHTKDTNQQVCSTRDHHPNIHFQVR